RDRRHVHRDLGRGGVGLALWPDRGALERQAERDRAGAVTVAPDARRLTFDTLGEADRPLSAERIARALKLELTSVYRNLETLERHGLVRHVHLGHGAGLYALVGRGEREYLYCERCGAVRALQPSELDPVRRQIGELFGYDARFTHFALVGTCPECARAGSSAPDRHEHRH